MIIISLLLSKFNIYHYTMFFLAVLGITSAVFYDFGIAALLPVLAVSLTALVLDIAVNYFKRRAFAFPYSAVISGLFIGGLLTQNLPLYIYIIAGIIAIASKHIIKIQQKHIFNPAIFGVLLASIIFGAAHSWWISSPIILMTLFGIFIIWRLRRLDLALSFLLSYFILSIIFNSDILKNFNEFYLFAANSGIILFFSMFMLIEPKTHPIGKKQRIIYGILVAILLILFNKMIPAHDLPLALAVGNVFVPILNKSRM